MDAVLYFHFYDPNDDFRTTRSLAFYAAHITTPWGELDRRMGYSERDIEAQYGGHRALIVLTISTTGTKLIGYGSSEIHGERCQQVMNVWRATFLNIANGCVVSDVYDVTNVGGALEIYRYVKDAHEHQQAQKLRETLNANITISASPTAAKKI